MDPDNDRFWRRVIVALALVPAGLRGLLARGAPEDSEVVFSLLVGGVLLSPVLVGALRMVLRRRRGRPGQAADSAT